MCRATNLGALLLLCTAAMAQDTRVALLGTGNPNPEPDRMGPAVAIISGDRVYLVDCGPGVVRRAAQAGIAMEQLTRAFITHLLCDHTTGLPDLIFTPAVTGRKEPLDIYGPPGLRAMTASLMKAYREDRQIRLHGLEPSVPQAYVVRARDVAPGEVYRDAALRVVAFAVNHGSWKHAYGYRFEAPDKTIVLSGDTTYSPNLDLPPPKAAIFWCTKCIRRKGLASRPADPGKTYHRAFHTSARDVGRLGPLRFDPKLSRALSSTGVGAIQQKRSWRKSTNNSADLHGVW